MKGIHGSEAPMMQHGVHYGMQEQEHHHHIHHRGLDHMNNGGVMDQEQPGENENSMGGPGDGSGGSEALDGDVCIDPGNLPDNQNVMVVHGVSDNGNQLTLSFQGQVYVFDSVSPEKVQAVLLLLGGQEVPSNIPIMPVNASANVGMCGTPQRFNVPQRLASLIRFREKRKERNFDKKIRYTVRKEVALRMQRNKGQFTSSKPNHDDSASAASSWDSNQSLGGDGGGSQQPESFCRHCGISDKSTPMMRRGPDGPRTLCNACGLMWANKGTLRDLSKATSHPGQTSLLRKNEENGNLKSGSQLVQAVVGCLVPVNYNGKWKRPDGAWRYDALEKRYIRVCSTTKHLELIEAIYAETGITNDHEIEVAVWDCFPSQQVMPPFQIRGDADIQTYIQLNEGKNYVIPLCISTSKKKAHCDSTSVYKPKPVIPKDEMFDYPTPIVITTAPKDEMCTPIGLDNIKLSFSEYDPFENAKPDEDPLEYDPFENAKPDDEEEDNAAYYPGDEYDVAYDSYFHVYVEPGKEAKIPVEKDTSHHTVQSPLKIVPQQQKSRPTSNQETGNDNKDWELPLHNGKILQDAVSSNVHAFVDFTDGDILPSKEEVIIRMRILSMKMNREFRISHSDSRRIIAVCVDKDCKWRLRASVMSYSGSAWIIRSYEKLHTCSIDARFKRCRGTASSEAVAHMFKGQHYDPGFMKLELNRVYGIKITYWKAWKAKEIASQLICGQPEESFTGLPSYLWLLEQANPGTYSSYQLDFGNCFRQCFLAFGASIAGFRSCTRPVIAVDAAHLKSRYRGKLFLATTMDGNNQIYPLAFGVGGSESDETWTWFFQQLRNVVGPQEDLVVISDRMPSIEKACMQTFPHADYGICMFHLGMNVNTRFKVRAKEFLYGVAKAYTELEFEDKIRRVRSTKEKVYDYLIDADPKKWARCFFPARRYSIMTTNIAESINALLKEAREYPIIGMLETIRTILQRWFYERSTLARSCTSVLTPYAERKLSKRDDKSRRFGIHSIDQSRFHMLDGLRDIHVDTYTNLYEIILNYMTLYQII